jgi:hypothetical protein
MSAPLQLIPNHRRPHVEPGERHTVLLAPVAGQRRKRVPLLLSPVLRALSWAAVVGIGVVLVVYGMGFLREGLGR